MFLVLGLGNPGKKYQQNRHNAGFLFLDWISDRYNINFQKSENYLYSKTAIENSEFLFVKPYTYMNLSGVAVQSVMHYYKIPVENLMVIVDDIALPFGKIRIRAKGSSGGHNGLKSIESSIRSNEYKRIRIGVGYEEQIELADYVLSDFSQHEIAIMQKHIFPAIFECINIAFKEDIELAMSRFNGIIFTEDLSR